MRNTEGIDIEKLRGYIKRCQWQWATSMQDIPHEYIVKGRCAISINEFYDFVNAQREFGVHIRWGKFNNQYLFIDGYKYWTMGAAIPDTKIMNRTRVFDEFDELDYPLYRPYRREEAEVMCATIMKMFDDKTIFECGIGNGDFVRLTGIKPEKYYGVDPAQKSISAFRGSMEGFYQHCSKKSFEEAHKKWTEADSVVIALFGTASYFMRPYLEKLSQSGKEYCLMFYKEGCVPDEFKEMYPLDYSRNDIKAIFPRANLYFHERYVTASSRKLVWQPSKTPKSLFGEEW